jgi:hypothetical protein
MLEVFRNYEIHGSTAAITALADELSCCLPHGWSRNQFIENENRQRIDLRMYVFVVPESGQHPMANVHFAAGENVAQIAGIEDQHHRESLPPKEYNVVAEKFASFCTPVAGKLGLQFTLTPDRYDIANDLTAASMRAFQVFSDRMSTSQGSEREGFLEFIVHTHRSKSKLGSSILKRWLIEVKRWPDDRAGRTAYEYEFGRELLRYFASVPSE